MSQRIPTSGPPCEILARPGGAAIAYRRTPGRLPGVIFLSGFMSDMTGGKATFLEEVCRRRGQAFLRFDYSGHGESSGAFTDGTIGRWAEDAQAALDSLTEGPQVLVGSSMGGWIMLLVALRRPERVAGLVGIAPAPDFTVDMLPSQLAREHLAAIGRDGIAWVESEYGPEPTPITRSLIEDGRNHLVLRRPLPIAIPVRLLHGMRDADVPWQTSLRLARALASGDVSVTLVKDGDHRLSEPADLERLARTLKALLDELEG
jgi:pimeloyl-ACP methyl ester carboxylesterase